MLVYVAQLFLDWLVRGVWRNPEGMNFPETRALSTRRDPARDLALGRAARIWGFVFALIAAVGGVVHAVADAEGLRGARARAAARGQGASPASRSSGMVFFAFLLSGALAGLAGISEVAGADRQLSEMISPGYGFTAIIVAFLGRLNPLGIVAAGLILALTYLGGEAAQISLGVSDKVGARLPGHAAVLRARLRHADPLPHPLRRALARAKAG